MDNQLTLGVLAHVSVFFTLSIVVCSISFCKPSIGGAKCFPQVGRVALKKGRARMRDLKEKKRNNRRKQKGFTRVAGRNIGVGGEEKGMGGRREEKCTTCNFV